MKLRKLYKPSLLQKPGKLISYKLEQQKNIRSKFQKQISKQNITRDIEVKNNLTVTRQEVGGNIGMEKVGRVFRNNYRHMDKTKGGGIRGGRWGWLELGGVWGNGDNYT